MAGWKDILTDVIKLTDEVKRLNQKTLGNCAGRRKKDYAIKLAMYQG
jgi:hypothetical protein